MGDTASTDGRIVSTFGYGNRDFSWLHGLVALTGVTCVVDIRASTKSRWSSDWREDNLRERLGGMGVEYVTIPEFGHVKEDLEPRNVQAGILRIKEIQNPQHILLLCAEKDERRCSRGTAGVAIARLFGSQVRTVS